MRALSPRSGRFSLSLSSVLLALLFAMSATLSGCEEGPTLIDATLVFDPDPGAAVVGSVMLVTISDGAGSVIQTSEQDIEEQASSYKFEIHGEDPPPGEYSMRVHVDMNDDGAENSGDYVSADLDVLNGTYPEVMNVTVTLIP